MSVNRVDVAGLLMITTLIILLFKAGGLHALNKSLKTTVGKFGGTVGSSSTTTGGNTSISLRTRGLSRGR